MPKFLFNKTSSHLFCLLIFITKQSDWQVRDCYLHLINEDKNRYHLLKMCHTQGSVLGGCFAYYLPIYVEKTPELGSHLNTFQFGP